jgi:hypothetical protein
MLRRAGILIVASVLGAGSAVGVAACGEDRGEVQIEGETGGTGTGGTGTAGTQTAGTVTTGTETAGTETTGTETAGTETERTTTSP